MSNLGQRRTHDEALNDLAYEIRLRERHVRLFRRVRAALAFIALCGGATAFANLFNDTAVLRGIGGALVAACAFLDTVFDFANKASAHESQRRRFQSLMGRAPGLGLAELDAALAEIRVADPGDIEALRVPAMNDVLLTRGYPEFVRPLSGLQRLLSAIA